MKKLTILVAALVLALGLAQCKKEQPATPQNTEGNLVHITVNVGNGSRADVDPSTGAFSFRNGDKLYVGYDSACVGTLEYNASTNKFSGNLNNLTQNGDQPLHFYYLGGYGEYVNQVDETQYTVDIYEQQFNPYDFLRHFNDQLFRKQQRLLHHIGEPMRLGGVHHQQDSQGTEHIYPGNKQPGDY